MMNTNTSQEVTLPPGQADELAGLLAALLGWLNAGNPAALDDFETHLRFHAAVHGGTFDTDAYLDDTEAILPSFTALIDAYWATFDQPDDDPDEP